MRVLDRTTIYKIKQNRPKYLQRDNRREWQRDQKNYVGQTPHRRQPRCYGGHVMLYDGAPSSNDPPNIQIHGYQASHGHTTQSQRYPHCSGRTGMPSQAATACFLPADQNDAFMPQYDQYNDQHHGRQVSHVYSSHPSQAFEPRSFGGTGVLYAGRASSRPDRRDADLPRHNPRKYHGKSLRTHSSYQSQGLSRSSGPGASILYPGAPSSDVP
ncbi:uncharacterized protein LOC110243324 isoform X2 [Exaiptasia diaphana]|uniref:Uncharacterized protein n=1 Tax=Exaiptasia diaphana TaxID=2652724 RepID=A0A913YL00_EXADI|nr:uncharacterized protein LOC110243324 isoform X1 [Exaiptasia diaphana]XP_028516110.1 uncharacterized protein LOC110243324 isoform X2 [Exaiptasia diaphana]